MEKLMVDFLLTPPEEVRRNQGEVDVDGVGVCGPRHHVKHRVLGSVSGLGPGSGTEVQVLSIA